MILIGNDSIVKNDIQHVLLQFICQIIYRPVVQSIFINYILRDLYVNYNKKGGKKNKKVY